MGELAAETFYVLTTDGWVSLPPRCAVCHERWGDSETVVRDPFSGEFHQLRHQDCPEPESWRQVREAKERRRWLKEAAWSAGIC